MIGSFPQLRLRRLRQHPVLRDLVRETQLLRRHLVFPLFIKGKEGKPQPIASMPGHSQLPLNALQEEIESLAQLGLRAILLFGIPSHKDAEGSAASSREGIIQEAIRTIRSVAPDFLILTDLCFCEYTNHGHCGLLDARGNIDNDRTLTALVQQALSHAEAGADVIAPSGMIDGMVATLRYGLDQKGFSHIPLLSYAVKYNSSLYGPFRIAAEGAPSFGDRANHQMDPANAKEALREVALDVAEGADMVMVKPAHANLDVIYRVKEAHPQMPLGAYHTSGEFCMLKAAALQGWLDEKRAALEILGAIRRAGADFIITYYAKELAKANLIG